MSLPIVQNVVDALIQHRFRLSKSYMLMVVVADDVVGNMEWLVILCHLLAPPPVTPTKAKRSSNALSCCKNILMNMLFVMIAVSIRCLSTYMYLPSLFQHFVLVRPQCCNGKTNISVFLCRWKICQIDGSLSLHHSRIYKKRSTTVNHLQPAVCIPLDEMANLFVADFEYFHMTARGPLCSAMHTQTQDLRLGPAKSIQVRHFFGSIFVCCVDTECFHNSKVFLIKISIFFCHPKTIAIAVEQRHFTCDVRSH